MDSIRREIPFWVVSLVNFSLRELIHFKEFDTKSIGFLVPLAIVLLTLFTGKKGDWQGALEYLESARADEISPEMFWHRVIQNVEELLRQNNQPLPWKVGLM